MSAKPLKDIVHEDGIGHNSKHGLEEMAKLIQNHSAVHDEFERRARQLSDDKKKANQNFKAETGITIADFMAARRLAQIEDDGERKEKRDNLAIVFNALSVGEQLDWIDVVEDV